jgi:hypothetical protein
MAVLAAGLVMAGVAQGQNQTPAATPAQAPSQTPAQAEAEAQINVTKIGTAPPVTYLNRWEAFGAFNFMNFQGGQNLPKRMNLGGFEFLGTYWVTHRIGLGLDYRIDAGTTPVFSNAYVNNRPLVYMNTLMPGAQFRWFSNQYVAVNVHGYAGVSHGTFTYSTGNVPPLYLPTVGLYTNRTKFMSALGGSIDFNLSKKWAVRLSPDLILEHYGTELREFVGVSGGPIYRFGNK